MIPLYELEQEEEEDAGLRIIVNFDAVVIHHNLLIHLATSFLQKKPDTKPNFLLALKHSA